MIYLDKYVYFFYENHFNLCIKLCTLLKMINKWSINILSCWNFQGKIRELFHQWSPMHHDLRRLPSRLRVFQWWTVKLSNYFVWPGALDPCGSVEPWPWDVPRICWGDPGDCDCPPGGDTLSAFDVVPSCPAEPRSHCRYDEHFMSVHSCDECTK